MAEEETDIIDNESLRTADGSIKEKDENAESTQNSSRGEEQGLSARPIAGNRQKLAQSKVEEAREKVKSAEEEIEICLQNIRNDLEKFGKYEKDILIPVVEEGRSLLKSIGMDEIPAIELPALESEFENHENDTIQIDDLPSGKGSSFFFALLGGIAVLASWFIFAALRSGMPVIPDKIPDLSFLSLLAENISDVLGIGKNPAMGAAVATGTALLFMWIIYAVRVSMRSARNLKQAEKIEEEAGFYCRRKEECRAKMEEVRKHLKSLDQTIRRYEVVLAEKNASLRRAIHIEENSGDFNSLHEKTKETARETYRMIRSLERLLETPMARAGMLTSQSVEALREAKRMINDMILRLYS